MAAKMLWTLMFRVNDLKAARGRLALAETLLGRSFSVGTCERYWKIPELWTCPVQTPLHGATGAEIVLDCLVQAQRLTTGWNVHGLDIGPQGNLLGFEGVFALTSASKSCLSGLEWASFSVGTDPEL